MSSYPSSLNVNNVRLFAEAQTARSAALAQMRDGVTQISGSSDVTQWQASAAETFRLRLARIVQLTSDVTTVSSTWATSAGTYADQLESMASRGKQAELDIQRGISQRQGLSHVPPDMLPDGQWARRMDEAEELINHGNMVLGNLHYERSGIDGEFARALAFAHGSGLTVQWMQLATMYDGARTAQDILDRRADLLQEALDLAAAVAKRPADPDDIAALAAALRNASADPNLSSQFWLEVGGDGTLPLLEAGLLAHTNQGGMGYPTDEDRDAALAFARSVRESLASGSQLWNTEQGEDFAARMMTGADWPGDMGRRLSGVAGVGFLFDDAANHPMGRAFTVAAADIFDTWERSEQTGGEPWGSSGMDPTDPYGVFDSIAVEDQFDRGGSYDSNVGESRYGAGVRDPFGRVLDTLGTYPDAAWEWLNDNSSTLHDGSASVAGDRVDYLSRRDWSADGWDGFGSLWEGSMHADGGFASENQSEWTLRVHTAVALRIMEGLDSTSPNQFAVDAMSEAGATALGQSLAHLMPIFAESISSPLVSSEPSHSHAGYEWSLRNIPGLESSAYLPDIPTGLIESMFGTVGGTDAGFAHLYAAAQEASTVNFAQAQASGELTAWSDAFERHFELQGKLSGSIGGVAILEARFHDAEMQQRIDLISTGVGLIPLPGLSEAASISLDVIAEVAWNEVAQATTQREGVAVGNALVSAEQVQSSVESFISSMHANPQLNFGGATAFGSEDYNRLVSDIVADAEAAFKASIWDGAH